MSISTGTLNLKFMQRGTPLQATPSKTTTPVPTTPSTPVPSSSSSKPGLQLEQEDQWSLSRSTLDRLRSSTEGGPTPIKSSKTKGRVTYETSYLPFLAQEEDRRNTRNQGSDEDVEMSSEEEDKGVGSSRMVKGRMIFGQPIKPEKKYISDEEQTPAKGGPNTERPMVSGNQRWKALGKSFDPTSPSASTSNNPSTPLSKSKRPSKLPPKKETDIEIEREPTPGRRPNKTGFIRPGGFEDLPHPTPTPSTPKPTTSATPATQTASAKKSKKKRKTSKPKEQEPENDGSDSDEILYQGARKKQKPTTQSLPSGASGSLKQAKKGGGGDSSDEIDEFINGIMDELDQD